VALVQLYEYIYRSDGTPISGIPGYLKVLSMPSYATSSGYLGNPEDSGFKSYTNISGMIYWMIPESTVVQIRIDYVDLWTDPITIVGTGLVHLQELL